MSENNKGQNRAAIQQSTGPSSQDSVSPRPVMQPAYVEEGSTDGYSDEEENEGNQDPDAEIQDEESDVSAPLPDPESDEEVSNYFHDNYKQNHKKDNEKVNERRAIVKQNEKFVNEIMDYDYGVNKEESFLPPVSDRLANTISKWLKETPKREKVKELFDKMSGLRPLNVTGLEQVRINEVLYEKLPYKAKINDQRLRGINAYLVKGIGPLISILDNMIRF